MKELRELTAKHPWYIFIFDILVIVAVFSSLRKPKFLRNLKMEL